MQLQLGDNNATVLAWRVVMNQRFGALYTRLHGAMPIDTSVFGMRAVSWQQEYERRTNQPVDGIVSDGDLRALGIPIPPTHAMLTVRGTGGIIGLDYTSVLAQALPGIYHEVPIDYAASMGGIPVGASTSGPSGDDAANQSEQMLTMWVMTNTGTFGVSGYSLGNKGVIQFLNKLFDPAHPLYPHRTRLVCVVLIADPWRPFGKSFYLGPVCSGQGIGTPYFTMSTGAQTELGWRACWLAQENDMYTNAPLGATGQVLADVEQIVLGTSLASPLATMGNAVKYLLQIVTKDGGLQTLLGLPAASVNQLPAAATPVNPLGGLLGGLGGLGGLLGGAGGLGGLLGGGGVSGLDLTSLLGGLTSGSTPLTTGLAGVLVGSLTGLIDGITGDGANMPTGIGADVQAMILALKFFGGGIRGHLTYDVDPWSANSGQTYLQLGIQHAADWGARTPVLA